VGGIEERHGWSNYETVFVAGTGETSGKKSKVKASLPSTPVISVSTEAR